MAKSPEDPKAVKPNGEDQLDPRVLRREVTLDEITKSRDEALRVEIGPEIPVESLGEGLPAKEPTPASTPSPEGVPAPEKGSGPAVEAGVAEAAPAPQPAADPLVTIQVDGQPRQVRQSELVAAYQMDSAARERLREASETAKRLREMETQRLRELAPAAAPAPEAPKIDYASVARALQFEEPETAGKKLEELVTNLQKQAGPRSVEDPNKLVEAAVERSRIEREWETSLASFGQEFEDILTVANPDLALMAGTIARTEIERQIRDARNRNEQRPPFSAILRDAGLRARKALQAYGARGGKDSPQPPEANPGGAEPKVQVPQSRIEAKRVMSQPPTARSVPASMPEQPPSDPDQVIAASRKAGLDEMIASRARRHGTT